MAAAAASLGCAVDEVLDFAGVEPLLGLTDLAGGAIRARTVGVGRPVAVAGTRRETDAGRFPVDAGARSVEPLFRCGILVPELSNSGLPGRVRVVVPNGDVRVLAHAVDEHLDTALLDDLVGA